MSKEILLSYLEERNLADRADEIEERSGMSLDVMARTVIDEYDIDVESRMEWVERNKEGMALAQQIKEGRSYAGESVADVKYPTIAAAALQFQARAYPAVVRDQEVVKYIAVGADPNGVKAARGARVAQYMNWELLCGIENWDEDMDTLLIRQPILGIYFKKCYHDPVEDKVRSELVDPEDLVMYYYSNSFDTAPRKTHKIYLSYNQYLEQVRAGCYLDDDAIMKPEASDDGGLMVFLEQHRTFDLDGDDYEEPYIVTVHEESQKIVRIVARYEERGITTTEDGTIVKITPIEHFIAYPFMPSLDGGVYGMGFGFLLGPLNESINTLLNQTLDAGTRAVRASGFIGRGVKVLRGGESGTVRLKSGEWRMIQASGDDLRKAIFPIPVNGPSDVLFQLLGFLVSASKELASQSDLLAGQQEQHNIPATSTLELIEQGLQVFATIYKRIYRALSKETKRVHRLEALHLKAEKYKEIVDDPRADLSDFVTQDYDIRPVSTTTTATATQKRLKAQALMPMMNQGLDDMEIKKFYLESLEVPDAQRFMPKAPPEPPPQFKLAMRELDLKERDLMLKEWAQRTADLEIQGKLNEMRERAVKLRADALAAIAKAESLEQGNQMAEYEQMMVGLLDQIYQMEKLEERRRMIMNQAMQGRPGPGGPPQPQPQPKPAPGPAPAPKPAPAPMPAGPQGGGM